MAFSEKWDGLRYTENDVDALPITCHYFHSEWNYTISPFDTS
jgi:hypothetical protein